MRLARPLLAVAFVATLSPAVRADDVRGAVWLVDFKNDKSSVKFQCTKNGKVFGPGGKELGTWKGNGPQATITVTSGGPRNGVYEITQLGKNPPTFRGKYTNAKGEDVKISVSLVKD